MKTKITLTWLVLLGLLTGCANDYHYWEAKRLQADGKQDEAMTKLTQLSIDYPHNAEYKMALSNLQERQAARLIADADNYRLVEDFANAAILYNKALKFQPGSPRAKAGLELIERDRNHARLLAEAEQANKKKDFDAALDALNLILGENPAHTKAKNLKRLIDAARNRETMASSPLMGMVNTQAQMRLMVTPQRTADRRLVAPTPMMEPVMVCVVLTGIFRDSVTKSVMAPAVSAATPSKGVTLVIRLPMVFTIFQPPLMVPRAIAV